MILYSDLDETLVARLGELSTSDGFTVVVPRPGAYWFLENLSKHGEVVLLTMSTTDQAKYAVSELGPAGRFISKIIAREDLAYIGEQLAVIERAGLSPEESRELLKDIEPIYPPGFVFDDYPVGSWMYDLKGRATGTPAQRWIEVDEYIYGQPDYAGLRKAYSEFLKRKSALPATPSLGRRRLRA